MLTMCLTLREYLSSRNELKMTVKVFFMRKGFSILLVHVYIGVYDRSKETRSAV